MFQVFGLYLAAAGGASAGAQVARGLVRGAARLVRGDARGALTEAAGGLAAPVVSAVNQFSLLGADVYKSATTLGAQVRERAAPAAVSSPTRPPSCRQRAPATAANGAS